MEKIQKYLPIATFIFVLFIFLKGCGTGTQVKSTEKKVETLTTKVDSLTKIVVTQDEMIDLLQNTTMWQTLIIEELSDKDHMPINHYRSESGK
jgi:PBP1b-binding outer membrane lipoprotein LpoB